MKSFFDVIVIGGGHAGTEAALAVARMQLKCLLISHSIETLGQMSCNPAIGGIGKGHLVKEIDALGGVMAEAADYAGIQFRTLNASKGAAVQATRTQADRQLYRHFIRQKLENSDNLSIFQEPVDDLIIENDEVKGVVTQSGLTFNCHSAVLTAGTFLAGKIHIGDNQYSAGRAGDPPALTLAHRLREIFNHTKRLKTGTPPRIDARTVDFSKLEKQPGDSPPPSFSYLSCLSDHPKQVCCHITHTNEKTHQIIQQSIDQSPLFNGNIEGVGPRYCPSIEDKIVRFFDKNSHQIFIEPESLNSNELYPNGISTSLPFEVQEQFVHSIIGFEKAHITRPGYAIEYDFFDPQKLHTSLQTQQIKGLFFAGQINGTTGYEEAAAQGLLAGTNAALYNMEQDFLTIGRDQGYVGVLVDDLITMGTTEPYRMFTSRAEYRLSLREDNADIRLTEIGRKLGLVDDFRWHCFSIKKQLVEQKNSSLNVNKVNTELKNKYQKVNPNRILQITQNIFDQAAKQIAIQQKYEGYLQRQEREIERLKTRENLSIPQRLDYQALKGLSNEVKQKLMVNQPQTIGQASRLSGVTPAAISILLVAIKKISLAKQKNPASENYPVS